MASNRQLSPAYHEAREKYGSYVVDPADPSWGFPAGKPEPKPLEQKIEPGRWERFDVAPKQLGDKLDTFDEHAAAALAELLLWLKADSSHLIALARGRHVWGHYRYGDRNYAEYDEDRLTSEAAEEIADAICYLARRRALRETK